MSAQIEFNLEDSFGKIRIVRRWVIEPGEYAWDEIFLQVYFGEQGGLYTEDGTHLIAFVKDLADELEEEDLIFVTTV